MVEDKEINYDDYEFTVKTDDEKTEILAKQTNCYKKDEITLKAVQNICEENICIT